MQPILGIDWGKAKVGLALATSPIPEPLDVIRYQSMADLLSKLEKVIEDYGVDLIVVGISEQQSEKDAKAFAQILKKEFKIKIVLEDETLTTKEAQEKAIEAGIRRSKRRRLEDAYAAALILENYLDRQA